MTDPSMERLLRALTGVFDPLGVPVALSGRPMGTLPSLCLPLSLPPFGEAAHVAPILWFPRDGDTTVPQWMAQLSRLVPPGGISCIRDGTALFLFRDTPFLTLLHDPDDPLVLGIRMGLTLRMYGEG